MFPLYFPALLKTDSGMFLEAGEACLAEQESSVLFNSDFVPLLQLGSPAQIVRVWGDEEFERFCGRVYLSSRKLLQLTDIDTGVMEQARAIFSMNQNIPVQLALAPLGSPRFNVQKAQHVSGHLRYIGAGTIKLMAMEEIPPGQILSVSVQTPELTLRELKVKVIARTPLQNDTAILQCELLSPGGENANALRTFLEQQPAASKKQ